MTATVHRLPDPMARQWEVFERHVRAAFSAGCTPGDLDQAMEALRPIYLRCATSHKFNPTPESIEQSLQQLSDWVRDFGTGLMLEIAVLEVEAIRAGLRSK